MIVDTGCAMVRDGWTSQVFSVVEPGDVRWIFLSHDDHDHIGNLEHALDLCPQRHARRQLPDRRPAVRHVDLPLERMRWLDAGDSFDAGDRTLTAVRPPMFDSPATRGLYDSSTRLLWAADSFGSFFPGEVVRAWPTSPPTSTTRASSLLNAWNTPWLEWVDADRFAAHVAHHGSLPLEVVASAHGPVLRGVADRTTRSAARSTLAAQPRAAGARPGRARPARRLRCSPARPDEDELRWEP